MLIYIPYAAIFYSRWKGWTKRENGSTRSIQYLGITPEETRNISIALDLDLWQLLVLFLTLGHHLQNFMILSPW